MKLIHLLKHVIARVSSTLIDEYDDEPLPSGPTRLMLMIINNFFKMGLAQPFLNITKAGRF